jgi:GWxTD domain-containing protein
MKSVRNYPGRAAGSLAERDRPGLDTTPRAAPVLTGLITTGLTLLIMCCSSVLPAGRALAVVTDAKVGRLEAELARSAHPDSVRLELAAAYRELDTPESRLRALWLLEQVESRFTHDNRYLREYCLTLEACHRYDLACQAAERLIEVAADETDIRLVCVRNAVRALIRYDDESFLDEALSRLDDILAREPLRPDVLRLKSFLFAYWALRDRGSAPRAHREGLACAEEAVRQRPGDIDARLLEGVHLYGRGESERAEISFRLAISHMGPEEREVFLTPPVAGDAEELPGREGSDAEARPDSAGERATAWRRLDPIPLSVVNEGQLEFWCRLTLADAIFGDNAMNVRGWETDPGRALVRYGPPEERSFDPAYVAGGDASYAKFSPRLYDRRHDQDTRMPTEMPRLAWTCRIGGQPVSLEFRDLMLDGSWRATPETRQTLNLLEENVPISFVPEAPARTATVHLLASSFAAREGRSRVVVTLGFDPAITGTEPSARDSLLMAMELLDAEGRIVASDRWRITDDDLCAGTRAWQLAQTTREYSLEPGEHVMAARIERGGGMPPGEIRIPFLVDAFPTARLAVSDLELIREGSAECSSPAVARLGRLWFPCAVPMIGDTRALSTYFEIYNLSVDPQTRRERFQVRYTLMPRAYATAALSRTAGGQAEASDSLALGAPGSQMDETILTHRNYVDVLFPAEDGPGRPDACVPKAAALPIAALDAGAYELVVTVRDLVRGRSVCARCPLAIMTDGEIAAATGR